MAGTIRRISGGIKRPFAGDGDGASNVTDINQYTSDTADGLSDDVSVNPVDFGSTDDGEIIDAEAPYGRKADGTPRLRRGRKSGGASTGASEGKSSRAAKKKSALGVEGLASIMANLTLMVAAATKVPEVVLSNDETTLISDAVENVAQYYDFSLNSKAVAWTNLAVTVGGIVGAHVVAYKLRRDHEQRLAA